MKALFNSENYFSPCKLHSRNTEVTGKTSRRNHILERLQHLQCSGLISDKGKREKQYFVEETTLRPRYFASTMIQSGKKGLITDSLGKPFVRVVEKPKFQGAALGMQIPPSHLPDTASPTALIPPGDPPGEKRSLRRTQNTRLTQPQRFSRDVKLKAAFAVSVPTEQRGEFATK